jgi:hypothetical protein
MVPITRRDEANNPPGQQGNDPRDMAQSHDGNRQPEMSEPDNRLRGRVAEPDHWMVPDTRDDIVVSRIMDY